MPLLQTSKSFQGRGKKKFSLFGKYTHTHTKKTHINNQDKNKQALWKEHCSCISI